MPTVSQILDQRQARRGQQWRDIKPRLGLSFAVLLSLGFALLGLLAAIGYLHVSQELPSIDELPLYFEPPDGLLLQPTRLYDRSGEHVLLIIQNPQLVSDTSNPDAIAAYRRKYLSIRPAAIASTASPETGYLPNSVILTTIAAADPDFWKHPGVTIVSLLNPNHQTLAQQLVSSLLLFNEPPGMRKEVREWLLAIQVTSRFGREKVLEWYLNSASYGRFSYGIDEAARLYFAKPVSQLTLAEAALLAGVAQVPSLNPHDAPQSAMERQKFIIQELLRLRWISPQEGIQAALEQFTITPAGKANKSLLISDLQPGNAPAFINLAISELETILPRNLLEKGGYAIRTSLDYRLQLQANCLVHIQASRQNQPGSPVSAADCPAIEKTEALETLLSTATSNLPAEALVINPQNGQVLALASSSSAGLQAGYLPKHPGGSLATTFVYLAAFTRGLSPASLVWDTPSESAASIRNPDHLYHGPLRVRVALANDYLVAAQKILEQVGVQNVQQVAREFDLPVIETSSPALISSDNLIGDVDILQVSRAYGIFANQGLLAGKENLPSVSASENNIQAFPGVSILKIDNLHQLPFYQAPVSPTRPVISAQLAYLVNHILSDEPARWASLGHPNPLETGYPLAVKSSQTMSGSSNWIVGYTSDKVISVWLGTDGISEEVVDRSSFKPTLAAASLWRALARYTMETSPVADPFSVPAGVVTLRVCDPSGMLPDNDCPNLVDEVFLSGNEPLQADTLFEEMAINRETGHLATVFTPSELIEKRVYMLVPEEELSWVQEAGIPSAPTTYDRIPSTSSDQAGIQVRSPEMFDYVRGVVTIQGLLPEEELSFFRVQIGPGIHPQSWYQVGEDFLPPFTSPIRVDWDTSGLAGLYTIQLLAVRPDQSILKTNSLVTVDNQPPQITIQQPYSGEIIPARAYQEIIFQADVQDDLGIERVEFYLDDQLIASRSISPFIAAWKPVPGEHTLVVVAIDQAGNQASTEIPFIIR